MLVLLWGYSCSGFSVQAKAEDQDGSGSSVPSLERARRFLFNNTDSSLIFTNRALADGMHTNDSLLIAESLHILALNQNLVGNNNQALKQLNKSLAITRKIKYDSLTIFNLLQTGELFYNWGRYDTAFYYFHTALAISKRNNLSTGVAHAYLFIGKYHHSIGKFSRSLKFYNKAFAMANVLKDTTLLMSANCKIGKHYQSLGDMPRALALYLEAERISTGTRSDVIKATTFNHLGNLYDELAEYEKAFQYHQKALSLRSKISYREGEGKSYNNLGEVLLNLQHIDSAGSCFEQSLIICREIGYKKGIIKSTLNLGKIAMLEEKAALARDFFTESLQCARETSYEKGVIKGLIRRAEADILLGGYAQSIQDLNDAEKLAMERNMLKELCDISYFNYIIYNELGKYKKALDYYIQFARLRAEFDNAEKDKQIAELTLAYETEKKDRHNELLVKENQLKDLQLNRKNTLMISSIVLVTFLVIITLLLIRRTVLNREVNIQLRELNEEIVAKNSALSQLNKELSQANQEKDKFFSIISHELRNPLWWFRNMTELLSRNIETYPKSQIKRAVESLDESAKASFHLIENLLFWSKSRLDRIVVNPVEVSFNAILDENLNLYKNLLHQKEIDVHIDIPQPVLLGVDRDLFNAVVRNLLSNALKFTPIGRKIQISGYNEEENAVLIFRDSGIGIAKKDQIKLFDAKVQYSTLGLMKEKGSGLGLILCKEFIELNRGKIWLANSSKEGTEIHIVLPLAVKESAHPSISRREFA